MIVIEPVNGLCNRMRALDSAIALADLLDQPLRVVWCCNQHLNCRYDELFEVPEKIDRMTQVGFSWSAQFIEKWSRKVRKRAADYFADTDDCNDLMHQHYDFGQLCDNKYIYLRAWCRFYSPCRPSFYHQFVPVEPLRKVIDSYRQSDNMVGVHIRRSDNKHSIEGSPTSVFIEKMCEEAGLSKDVKFFLATDSPDEERQLEGLFPGRIVTHRKASLDRNDPRAIKDALIDLYSLSNCRKLIGSCWSSFTDTAWQLRGIGRVIVNTNEQASPAEQTA